MDTQVVRSHADDQPAAPRYHAFLLRLWCDDAGGWHASLQAPVTTTRRGFGDLDQLIAFLRGLCAPPTGGLRPPSGPP